MSSLSPDSKEGTFTDLDNSSSEVGAFDESHQMKWEPAKALGSISTNGVATRGGFGLDLIKGSRNPWWLWALVSILPFWWSDLIWSTKHTFGSSGFTPKGEETIDNSGFTPKGEETIDNSGFTPKGEETIDNSGFTPKGEETIDNSGFTPKGEETIDNSGFTPRGEETIDNSGFTPRGEETIDNSGFTPRGEETIDNSGFTPQGEETIDSSGFTPKGEETIDNSGRLDHSLGIGGTISHLLPSAAPTPPASRSLGSSEQKDHSLFHMNLTSLRIEKQDRQFYLLSTYIYTLCTGCMSTLLLSNPTPVKTRDWG